MVSGEVGCPSDESGGGVRAILQHEVMDVGFLYTFYRSAKFGTLT
jgi:hypothetical protein